MKKKKISNILLIVIASVIIAGGVIGALFLFQPKEEFDTSVSFLNVDEKEADSLLSVMTIEQKVAQLLIGNSDSILAFDSIIGGVFINSDSLEDYQEYYKKILLQNNIMPFVCQDDEVQIPNLFSHYYTQPSINSLMSIRDSLLMQEYFDFISLEDSTIGVNLNFISLINQVSDSINYDTSQIKYYQDLTAKFVDEFVSNNILVTLPYINIPKNDSTLNNLWSNFYDTQIKNGLPSVYLSEYKQVIGFVEKYKFGGVIIGNNELFEDYQQFLESDFDILLVESSFSETFENIVKIAQSKKKFKKLLDKKVKKVLLAKTWLKQNNNSQRDLNFSIEDVENKTNEVFFRKLTKYSSVVLNNNENYIPFVELNENYNCYVFGEEDAIEFTNIIKKYNNVTCKHLTGNPAETLRKIKIPSGTNLIFVLNDVEIDTAFSSQLVKFDTIHNLVIVNLGKEDNLPFLENNKHLIHIWNNDDISQNYAAQILYGGIETNAKLSVFYSDSLYFDRGIETPKTRLGYDIPEMVGIDSEKLLKIDSIVNNSISNYAFPGCQVFAAKDGVILIDNSYGYHTYSRGTRVKHNDIYDLASVTKIAATTISAMKMYEQGKLPLDKSIGRYFKDTKIDYDRIKPDTLIKIDTLSKKDDKDWKKKIKGLDTLQIGDSLVIVFDTVIYKLTPKNNIFKVTPRQMLTHQSGIQPAMPILKLMLLDNDYFRRIKDLYADGMDSVADEPSFQEKKDRIYSNHYIKDSATTQVAQNLYMYDAYQDTLWRDTKQLPVWSKKIYIYSDVNMIILQITIDSINGYGINTYTWKNFYKPLGLKYITFNARRNFNRGMIVPTERDTYWRRQLIWGYVHDPSSAVLGGVAGNAGLFSNAYSLGVLSQMLLNGGTYGGKRFLGANTISKFTATQAGTHRGLGFDKWAKKQIIAEDASPNTFGHTGFTGTCLWADPDNDIIFVFLSNRVHPTAKNWKINKYRVRQKIHQVIYDAILTD